MLFITAVDHWIHRLETYMLGRLKEFRLPEHARGSKVELTAEWRILDLFKKTKEELPLPQEMPQWQEYFDDNESNERVDFPKYKMQYGEMVILYDLLWKNLILGDFEALKKLMSESFNPEKTTLTLTQFKLLLVFRLQQQCVLLRKEAYERLLQTDKEQAIAKAAAEVAAKKQAEIEALKATFTKKQAEVKVIREKAEAAEKAAKEAKEKAEAAEKAAREAPEAATKASRGSKSTKKSEESAAKDTPEAAEQTAKEKAETAVKVAKEIADTAAKTAQEMAEALAKEEAQAEILAQEIAKAKTSAGLGAEKENKKQEEEPVLEDAEMVAEDSSAEGDEGEEEEEPEAGVALGENPSVRIVIAELKRAQISSTASEVERKSQEIPRFHSSDEILLDAIVEKIREVTELMTLLNGKAKFTLGATQFGFTPAAGETGDIFNCFRDTIKEIFGFFRDADAKLHLAPGQNLAFIDCSPEKIRRKNDPLLISYEAMVPYLLSNYGRMSHINHIKHDVSWVDSALAFVSNPVSTVQKSYDYWTYDQSLAKQKREFLLTIISTLRTTAKLTALVDENGKVNDGAWQNVGRVLDQEQKKAGEIKHQFSNRKPEFLQFFEHTKEKLQASQKALKDKQQAEALALAEEQARAARAKQKRLKNKTSAAAE